MDKHTLAETLRQQLQAVAAERSAARAAPALQAARVALKRFQSARLALTHADLLAARDSHDAAEFFLEELYGAHDLGQRDTDLARVIPTLQRMLSVEALHAITGAIMLDALSEQLDTAMAQRLGEQFDAAAYAAAYRGVGTRAQRERQLDLVQELGQALCTLVKTPFISLTLSVMRAPARLAGLGELQQFLERGFGTFKQMRAPAAFVATIVARERQVSANIYAGAAQPFALNPLNPIV